MTAASAGSSPTAGAVLKTAPARVSSRNTGPVSTSGSNSGSGQAACRTGSGIAGGGMYRALGRTAGRAANAGAASTSPSAGAGRLVPGTQAPPFQ
ncbi:hypothetical protein [Kitasatospora sp. GAS204B]|uniref:hypothetical protein n=1 Tax=unclassified Kitasatospora TaxID=2633591 RepID=UPI002473C497|nr:hypothetical protein [Kitasatospora sp. GAS204B]